MYTQIYNYSTNEYDIDNTNKNYSTMGANTSTLRTEEITEMQALSHCMFSSSPHFTPSHPTSSHFFYHYQFNSTLLNLSSLSLLFLFSHELMHDQFHRKRSRGCTNDSRGWIKTRRAASAPMSSSPSQRCP